MTEERVYPKTITAQTPLKRRLSFVCVKYSDEYTTNFAASECTQNTGNQCVVVDNVANLHFQSLAAAINYGIELAQHELVIVVHEDIFFPSGWQSIFERALSELERLNPAWCLLGLAGERADGSTAGAIYEPQRSFNHWNGNFFEEVLNIESQVMIFRKDSGLRADQNIPSIHHIGRDLSMNVESQEGRTFLLNAPCIHQHRDQSGQPIINTGDSEKLMAKQQLGYLAGKACADVPS